MIHNHTTLYFFVILLAIKLQFISLREAVVVKTQTLEFKSSIDFEYLEEKLNFWNVYNKKAIENKNTVL